MTTRTIGAATVTAVGCGDVSLAVAAARGVDSRDVERALATALELGITMVDVAAEPDSEALVGATVRGLRLRDRVTTAMKIALLVAPGAAVAPSNVLHLGSATVGAVRITAAASAGRAGLAHVLPPAYVVARVEAMLKASKLDAIPLVQLPVRGSWRRSSAWPELVGTALRLVREGKVLQWGALVEDMEARELTDEEREERRTTEPELGALALVREPWLASLAITYNTCDRRAEPLIRAATAPVADSGGGSGTGSGAGSGSALALPPLGPDGKPLPPEFALYAMQTPAPSSTKAPSAEELAASNHRPAILARHPLAGAALAGTLGPGAKLTMRDDRNDIDAAVLEKIVLAVAKTTALVRTEPPAARAFQAARVIAEQSKRREDADAATLAELCLRYVIDRGAIALPRLHRHTHVPTAFIAASSPPLSDSITRALLEILT